MFPVFLRKYNSYAESADHNCGHCCLPQEERRVLDRELARAKVSASRVATVVANEWKDGSDKVMPVKQWLEERRFLQVTYLLFLFGFYLLLQIV